MAGTVTIVNIPPVTGNIGRLVATCTADASDATFPATALSAATPAFNGGKLLNLRTNPGATAPTANYDITLVDGDGLDRLQGVGANRHTTNSEEVNIVYSGTAINPVAASGETLTLTIANNAVNSAIVVATITYSTGG